jgi:hypothetical protein
MADEQKRNKFLTEAMGVCWHGDNCKHHDPRDLIRLCPFDFSTWKSFGELWEWAQKQDWFDSFLYEVRVTHESDALDTDLIHPNRFADAVYEFFTRYQEN